MPKHLKTPVVAAVMMFTVTTAATAQDTNTGRANELLVRAVHRAEDALSTDDSGERVALLREALSLLETIRREHSGTDLAVKLATGQTIGEFDADKVRARYQAAFSEVCLSKPEPACLEPLLAHTRQLKADLASVRGDLKDARGRIDQMESEAQSASNVRKDLKQARQRNDDLRARVDMLDAQAVSLRRRLARTEAALDRAESNNEAKDVRITNLSERLNEALAERVRELARYRSEFFGRLREVLGDNENIRVVGDRFVFQSEVLFDTSSAQLGPSGREQMRQLADTLKNTIAEIPDDINWILRVDGHTDRRPIQTPKFPSNWELSTARAVEVVKFLIEQGITAERLAAAGFGEYQPIAQADDIDALRKNRRIEFRLTKW